MRRSCVSLVLGLALSLGLVSRSSAAGFKAHGFTLPDGAVKIDDDRYRLAQTWEETLKFYKGVYPPAKFHRRTLPNQAGVRAQHLAAPGNFEWQGANLVENAKGEVHLFVLARPPRPLPEKPSAKPRQKRADPAAEKP